MTVQVYVVEVAELDHKHDTVFWAGSRAFSDESEAGAYMDEVLASGRGAKLQKITAAGSLYFLVARAQSEAPSTKTIPEILHGQRQSVTEIVGTVVLALAALSGQSPSQIRTRNFPACAELRLMGYWITARMCNRAWSDLGRAWGRDHSTVLQGCKRFQHDLDARKPDAVELLEAWGVAKATTDLPEAVGA